MNLIKPTSIHVIAFIEHTCCQRPIVGWPVRLPMTLLISKLCNRWVRIGLQFARSSKVLGNMCSPKMSDVLHCQVNTGSQSDLDSGILSPMNSSRSLSSAPSIETYPAPSVRQNRLQNRLEGHGAIILSGKPSEDA